MKEVYKFVQHNYVASDGAMKHCSIRGLCNSHCFIAARFNLIEHFRAWGLQRVVCKHDMLSLFDFMFLDLVML